MRQLHRLIFINSANIPYAEIPLDGNVHFIGTQGVGKSTILRAILFFYNANTQKLGIPSEKTPFAQYYFSYPNSYIIYEVRTAKHRYCIWAFKSQNRVNYRFIDSAYKKTLFINKNNSLTPNEVILQLNAKSIFYSKKKIDKYADYRDIIYGNYKREHKKYAILESPLYQNIPRTIGNVFLNSKLEATFIKKTIINSITEDNEPISIDLLSVRKSLSIFQKSYQDILLFKKHEKLGQRIVETFHHINDKKTQLEATANDLGTALQTANQQLLSLKEKLFIETKTQKQLKEKLNENQKAFNHQAQDFRDEMAVLKNQIKTARQKIKVYKSKNIEFVLNLNDQEDYLINQKETALEEQKILLMQHQSIDKRFQQLFKEVDQSKKVAQNLHKEKATALKQTYLDNKQQLNEQQEAALERARVHFVEARKAIIEELEAARKVVDREQVRYLTVKNKIFFKDELKAVQDKLSEENRAVQSINYDIREKENALKVFEKEALRKVEDLTNEAQQQQAIFQEKIQALEQDLKRVNQQVDDYEDTLYGYLDRSKKPWRGNIGKVFKEDILKRTDLRPKLNAIKDGFYGLSIDLSQIEGEAKAYDDFVKEKNVLEVELDKQKTAFTTHNETFNKQLTNLKKLNNKKIRTAQKNIQVLKEEEIQLLHKVEALKVEQAEWEEKSKIEARTAIQQQKIKLNQAKTAENELKAENKELHDNEWKNINDIKGLFKGYLDGEEQAYSDGMRQLHQSLERQLAEIEEKRTAIETQRQAALQGEGADTQQLKEIETRIKSISKQLRVIDGNKALVHGYQKDKQELIDRLPSFEDQFRVQNEELKLLEEQFSKQNVKLEQELEQQSITIKSIETNQRELTLTLESFEREFKPLQLYKIIQHWVEQPQRKEISTTHIGHLRIRIQSIHDGIEQESADMTKLINRFKSHFSEDNKIGLKTHLSEFSDYQTFAIKLEEIFELSLINHLELETQKHFNQIITEIASQTENLTSKKSEIDSIISKINKDFRSGNFVEAVQKIELRVGDSHNRIVQALIAIQTYKEENPFIVYGGENNLFETLATKQQPQKAIKLIQNLSDELVKATAAQIHLEDSFELEFRVEENNNDTGWVSRIANVGSNGTDVLVKAMVYIMLLNVFKNKASKRVKDFKIHCIIDEVGILHDSNLKGLVKFANERNILLINGSPNPNDVAVYKHTLLLTKNKNRQTQIIKLISN